LLSATFINVPLLLILPHSQNVAWLSVKEFEGLKYFFFWSVPRSDRFIVVDGNIQHTSAQTYNDVIIFISVVIWNIFNFVMKSLNCF
jgi:hypothetical protein